MLKITVKYFLSGDGSKYFKKWFQEVEDITSKQDGFISLTLKNSSNEPIVCLCFESVAKLEIWASTKIHDHLNSKIEPFFIKPQEVHSEMIDDNK